MVKYDYRLEYPLAPISLTYIKDDIWFLNEDIEVLMTDSRTILIPKGFETDLSSIPQIFWGVFKPFDKGLLGDLIHDYLWEDKMAETLYYNDAYKAQKFADEERLKWRNKLAPELKIKNWLTHKVLRIFGAAYYKGKKKIPK